MTTMRFFFIGSWTEGMFHFEKLKPFIVSCENANISGIAYRLPVGFPVLLNCTALNTDHDLDQIPGQLIELKYDETLLSLLDTFHGVNLKDPQKGVNLRSELQVVRSNGEVAYAQCYLLNPKKLPAKSARIQGGIWQQMLETQPPLTTQLTERQKTYVLKLGAVRGRDIVPINDLSLYRELMNLELIVDKGRRLALSPLGKEVYNHLV